MKNDPISSRDSGILSKPVIIAMIMAIEVSDFSVDNRSLDRSQNRAFEDDEPFLHLLQNGEGKKTNVVIYVQVFIDKFRPHDSDIRG